MARARRICPKPGCPRIVNRRYCVEHEREYEAKRGNSNQRGYGAAHQAMRAHLNRDMQSIGATCVLCGQRINPGEPWHLDHAPDRSGYRGPAHASCNTSDGGRRAHELD